MLNFALKEGRHWRGGLTNQFPFGYYGTDLEVQYPDGNKDRALFLPGVVIYNSQRTVGTATRYLLGFLRGFVGYFDTAVKKAYSSFNFTDRRFAATPNYVWIE